MAQVSSMMEAKNVEDKALSSTSDVRRFNIVSKNHGRFKGNKAKDPF